jgi:hypothetical protein
MQTGENASNYRHGGATGNQNERVGWLRSYYAMMQRCYSTVSDKDFANYQARGITVCDRWRGYPDKFFEDMGDRPEGMTIDRIDNDGIYEPGNCKWSTDAEQIHNRRNTASAQVAPRTLALE